MNDFINSILDMPLDSRTKGIPIVDGFVRLRDVGAQGWNVVRGDMMFPLLTLREERMKQNLSTMRSIAEHHNVCLAPHGKSTVCPQLYRDQIDVGGSWGITAATVQQTNVVAASGVDNIIIANQVMGPANIASLAAIKTTFPQANIYSLVDSLETLRHLVDYGAAMLSGGMRFQVLLEAGYPGGRTGVRTMEQAVAVLDAIARESATVQLCGIESYEGTINLGSPEETIAGVDQFLDFCVEILERAKVMDAFAGCDEVLLTAGGSAYFDRVVAKFTAAHSGPGTRIALRGGSYLTYDHGFYRTKLAEMDGRGGVEGVDGPINVTRDFLPALEIWSVVQSLQDQGMAIMSMGIRDLPYDLGYPTPLRQYRGAEVVGNFETQNDLFEITGANDQHAYMSYTAGADIRVGDLFCFGISHPCTAFDKWDVLYKVDEAYNVTSALKTFF
jgi:D-serine dehydratase